MDICKDTLTSLTESGYLTLQIPALTIDLGALTGQPASAQPPVMTIPDNWVCWLRGGTHTPAVGKESGFLFYTSIGFAAMSDDIRQAYIPACKRGGYRGELFPGRAWAQDVDYFSVDEEDDVWAEFEDYAKKQFADVKKNLGKALLKTQHKLVEAQAYGTPKSVVYWQSKLAELHAFVV